MENNYQEKDERYFKTKKRFEKIKAFYGHLIIYLSIIFVVILINLKYTPEFQWFWYSVIGGGIPLLIHSIKVFVFGANWEERKTQEILRKEDNKQVWK
jgi:cadmium resistance protein CadD (predicted permease)